MKYLKAIGLQLLVLFIVSAIYLFSYYNYLPDEQELVGILNSFLIDYGLFFMFVLSIGENLVGFNVYFPGSFAILFGMANTKGNIELAILTFFAIFVGVLFGNLINLLIGKFSSKNISSSKITYRKMILTLWHPHLSSLTSLQIGQQKQPFKVFYKYFLPISLIWNIFWGLTMYIVGSATETSLSLFKYLFFIYLTIWMIRDIRKVRIDAESNNG